MEDGLSWIFGISVVVAFAFAFGIGANDVANSFGTSIGSGALTMGQAIVIASIFEVTGAVTLGAGVSDTILRQISKLEDAACWDCGGSSGRMQVFMLGMACALASGAMFMLVATWAAMPVSTTHAIVGAVLGMTVVGAGATCVKWGYPGLLAIVASWFVSPVFAGLLSGAILVAIKRFVREPEKRAFQLLPGLFGGTVAVVLALVLLKATATQDWPAWMRAVVVLGVGLSVAGVVQAYLVPHLREKVQRLGHVGEDARGVWRDPVEAKYIARAGVQLSPALSAVSPQHGGGVSSQEEHLLLGPSVSRSSDEAEKSSPEPVRGTRAAGLQGTGKATVAKRKASTDEEDDPFWLEEESHPGHEGHQFPAALPDRANGGRAGALELNLADDPELARLGGIPPAERVFMYLQVLTACLKSYAHGANDTANAAGPFAAVQALYMQGLDDCGKVSTPIWVLVFCGMGIVAGLGVLGHRVMETVGRDITDINFSRGFAIELGSTLSVVLASVAGKPICMPVSSTHCQIGSIVAVGMIESGPKSVQWSVLSKIVVAWVVTVPLAAAVAAMLLAALRPILSL
ncbi:phosphate transporter [Coccomyxa subellipsoidea C-169]|uniref:Phosphate transporter n=1 Tax=Coccomyxa subellipsoidea (strain C-169) TaxID=574566 RepID=I0Z383_COCSC|nr:phosphate transporter [Coccomyxa subellipsoidea C-169]EIE25102.1 phosphate transporter [Coccomyxa subellipsoidea C-169]|eukprot:XP_005649646.1 phosphate transporter [Coccomyxa subellipsoidea C-169]